MFMVACLVLAVLGPAWSNLSPDATDEIRALLVRQQGDWNRGDIEAFMEGYERSDRLVFTSGGQVRRGWNATLERYRTAYPNRGAMGVLTFSEIEVRLVGTAAAVVLGKYELRRSSDRPHGVFTLVVEKGPEGWRIIHDHTSAAP